MGVGKGACIQLFGCSELELGAQSSRAGALSGRVRLTRLRAGFLLVSWLSRACVRLDVSRCIMAHVRCVVVKRGEGIFPGVLAEASKREGVKINMVL